MAGSRAGCPMRRKPSPTCSAKARRAGSRAPPPRGGGARRARPRRGGRGLRRHAQHRRDPAPGYAALARTHVHARPATAGPAAESARHRRSLHRARRVADPVLAAPQRSAAAAAHAREMTSALDGRRSGSELQVELPRSASVSWRKASGGIGDRRPSGSDAAASAGACFRHQTSRPAVVARSMTLRPNRLATRSTRIMALLPRSSRKGLSSTRSSEPRRPESWIISMMRWASR